MLWNRGTTFLSCFSTWLQMTRFHPFLWLKNIPFWMYIAVSSSLHQWMNRTTKSLHISSGHHRLNLPRDSNNCQNLFTLIARKEEGLWRPLMPPFQQQKWEDENISALESWNVANGWKKKTKNNFVTVKHDENVNVSFYQQNLVVSHFTRWQWKSIQIKM